jgi:RNA polymerase sigma-70 factor (ECF subfamily)
MASYCSWRTGSRDEAEDAVAEIFLIAWRKIDLVPDGDDARAWLYATARRVTANTRRSIRRRDALEKRVSREPFAEVPSPEVRATEEANVLEALTALSELDREVLLLVEWEGLSPSELATVLECAEVTARGRLHRARARFRSAYEEVIERSGPTTGRFTSTGKARS